ncbi:hypothetical protein BO86DRAFT_447249 [Aspergillus japonicus CBS 114.51]|uniref:Aminoglycoside phosphotransferase domain-containing protein n=1 Tax=Aspergillus japonicus CBS 114.51 TaxID=1448312 RepID=A0A8T8X5P5_ASPJA|nr:hypothetical protein BO86DRAFT_447249 [Aspergillus japonicus CBS 114.51]RAH83234.1 hypothetical protein BO86DRAFT_447249 [Aspergillus japonicus CBS 114.51]
MDFDDINLAAVDDRRHEWIKLAFKSGAGICELANCYRQRDDCMLRSMHCGSFNFSFRLNWDDDGEDWLIRFPLPGKSMFLDEKVRREALVMNYIARETTIPVPRVIAHGTSDEDPTGLGPFIIMTWIDGKMMSDILRQDDLSDKHDVLDLAIDLETLKTLYGEMEEVLLQLWGLNFSKIGSTDEDQWGKTIVDGRPLTRELNETYDTSVDYITSLLALQSTHLEQQRNSVYDSQDGPDAFFESFLPKANIYLEALAERERTRGLTESDDRLQICVVHRGVLTGLAVGLGFTIFVKWYRL